MKNKAIFIDLGTITQKVEKEDSLIMTQELYNFFEFIRKNYKVFLLSKKVKDQFWYFKIASLLEMQGIIEDHNIFANISELKEHLNKINENFDIDFSNSISCCHKTSITTYKNLGVKTFTLIESVISFLKEKLKKKIYLIGPSSFEGISENEKQNYFVNVDNAIKYLNSFPCFTIITSKRMTLLQEPSDQEMKEFIKEDVQNIFNADAIYRLYHWEYSPYSKMEYELAVNLKIPIYVNYEHLLKEELFKYEF